MIIFNDTISRADLDMNSDTPAIIVHPFCFCFKTMYHKAKRDQFRSHHSYHGYLANLEEMIRGYRGELLFFEEKADLDHLDKLIKDFGRESKYTLFDGSEEYLSIGLEDDTKVLEKLKPFKARLINVVGGNLDQYVYQGFDNDPRKVIDFGGCLGSVVVTLTELGYKVNIPEGLTFDHVYSMGFKVPEFGGLEK